MLSGRCSAVTAADIKEGPLSAARRTAEKYGLSNQVRFCLSDGLCGICPEETDDLVIAGMGGEMIVEILQNAGWDYCGKRLILQPMTFVPLVRRWLCEHGFEIRDEAPSQDGRHIYTVICADYTGNSVPCTELFALLGLLAGRSDPASQAYILREYRRLSRTAAGLARAGTDEMRDKAAFYISLCEQVGRYLTDGERMEETE